MEMVENTLEVLLLGTSAQANSYVTFSIIYQENQLSQRFKYYALVHEL